MPIIHEAVEPVQAVENEDGRMDLSGIQDEKGQLTVEGALLCQFLDDVDYTPLFEHEDLAELIDEREGFAKVEDGDYVECDEGDEGAEAVIIQTLTPDVVAETIDERDLELMFGDFACNEMEGEGVAAKATQQIAMDMLSDEMLLEYKRGEFSKIRKGGEKGKNLVSRMIQAMYAKGDIHRASSKKSAYKAPGAKSASYTRNYAKGGAVSGGYYSNPTKLPNSPGKRNLSSWRKYRSKGAASSKKAAVATIGAKTSMKGGKVTSQSIKANAEKAVAKKKLAGIKKGVKLSTAVAKLKAKKASAVATGKGKGKKIGESAERLGYKPDAFEIPLNESLRVTTEALQRMRPQEREVATK